jgi:hypothetical protein
MLIAGIFNTKPNLGIVKTDTGRIIARGMI